LTFPQVPPAIAADPGAPAPPQQERELSASLAATDAMSYRGRWSDRAPDRRAPWPDLPGTPGRRAAREREARSA